MIAKYISGLMIAGGCVMTLTSVGAVQLHVDVAANTTVQVQSFSGGQPIIMSLHNNNPSYTQFVPYSDVNSTAYTCNPLSWLSYLSLPIGQPLMRQTPNRGLNVSCVTQCGPLMRGTAYGDEPTNSYCADGSAKAWTTGSTTDKLYWTCASSPATQCRAYKGCIIEGHDANGPGLDPLASTVVGQNNVSTVKVAHNKAIQFGNGSSGPYDEESGLLRCVGGKLYHHVGDTTPICTTPLSYPFGIGPYNQSLSIYGFHPTNDITSATVYWFDGNNVTPSVLSVQSDTAYCDPYTGCPSAYAKDPNNLSQRVYNAGPGTVGTCPYSGAVSAQ